MGDKDFMLAGDGWVQVTPCGEFPQALRVLKGKSNQPMWRVWRVKRDDEKICFKRERRDSNVLGLETGVAGDAGQHRGAEFDGIVERKDEVRVPVSGENAMGCAALPLDLPADAQQRGFYASGPCGRPYAHAKTEVRGAISGARSCASILSAAIRNASA